MKLNFIAIQNIKVLNFFKRDPRFIVKKLPRQNGPFSQIRISYQILPSDGKVVQRAHLYFENGKIEFFEVDYIEPGILIPSLIEIIYELEDKINGGDLSKIQELADTYLEILNLMDNKWN